jgi:hypothetical protein
MTEIKYKSEVIATLESNQKAVLHLKDKKLTGDIDIVAPVPVEEWDGSVVIEGGVELISFTIDGVSYEAVDGMTWAEWGADEVYTKGDYHVRGDYYVYKSTTGQIVTDKADGSGVNVKRTESIIAGYSYGCTPIGN